MQKEATDRHPDDISSPSSILKMQRVATDGPPDDIGPPSSILTSTVCDKITAYYSSKRSAKREFYSFLKDLYVGREQDFLR